MFLNVFAQFVPQLLLNCSCFVSIMLIIIANTSMYTNTHFGTVIKIRAVQF